MKYSAVAILTIFALSVNQQASAEGMDAVKTIINSIFSVGKQCTENLNWGEELVELAETQKVPHALGCAIHCVLKAFNIVDEDGKLNMEFIDKILDNIPAPHGSEFRAVFEACKEQDGDKCDKIGKIASCLYKEAQEKLRV